MAGAANIYAWLPTVSVEQGRIPALFLCGAVLILMSLAYWRNADTPERRVLLAVTSVTLCPLLLPQMHDRYFFAAEVMALLFMRHKQLLLLPWIFASTGLFVYALYFLGNQYVLPLALASIFQVLAAGLILRVLWQQQALGTTDFPLIQRQ